MIVSAINSIRRQAKRPSLPERKSVKTVLVYAGELDPSIEEDGFFDYLVPAEKLLDANGKPRLPRVFSDNKK